MIILFIDSRQHFTLIVNNKNIPHYNLIKFMNALRYIIQEPNMQISITKTHCNTPRRLLLYVCVRIFVCLCIHCIFDQLLTVVVI